MFGLSQRQVHLDFHTSENIEGVGAEFDADEFARMLKEAHVESVSCFARCHHGMIYYDTRLPARHPHLRRNLLREQIDACHRCGIRVPVYITVGWDEYSASRHPEWLERDIDGRPVGAGPLEAGWRKLCLNTAYVDYVVEQTEEVLDRFDTDIDGLFFDIVWQGECCCNSCMSDMLQSAYDAQQQNDRRMFADLVVNAFKAKLTSAVRAKRADCTIFYNSGHVAPSVRSSLSDYTHLELESLPSGGWGYDHFPITARYARNLGKSFIGMTGRFLKSWGDFGGLKTQAALEYECCSALALGGGCSIGDQLHPSGRMTSATYELIGRVYKQIAEREPWCANANAVTEIGIINPDLIREGCAANGVNAVSAGVHRMLKERHYQYDFIDFEMNLSRYKLIVLPDVIRLDYDQATVVNNYVSQGGKLMLSYCSGMAKTGYDFLIGGMPARVKGEAPFSPDYLTVSKSIADGVPDTEYVMYERGLELEPSADAEELAYVWKPFFERDYKHFCSHSHTPVNESSGYPGIVANQNIIYFGYPIFGMYKRHGARVYRDIVVNALRRLLADDEKLVVTDAPTTAGIMLNYQPVEDRYILHVLHYIPERRYDATDTIEDVLPLYNVNVSIKLPLGFSRAVQVPQNMEICCVWTGARVDLTIPRVDGHTMIAITQ